MYVHAVQCIATVTVRYLYRGIYKYVYDLISSNADGEVFDGFWQEQIALLEISTQTAQIEELPSRD